MYIYSKDKLDFTFSQIIPEYDNIIKNLYQEVDDGFAEKEPQLNYSSLPKVFHYHNL